MPRHVSSVLRSSTELERNFWTGQTVLGSMNTDRQAKISCDILRRLEWKTELITEVLFFQLNDLHKIIKIHYFNRITMRTAIWKNCIKWLPFCSFRVYNYGQSSGVWQRKKNVGKFSQGWNKKTINQCHALITD